MGQKLITKQELKNLKQIITPTARPTLKTYINPLNVRLIINTTGSKFLKTSMLGI